MKNSWLIVVLSGLHGLLFAQHPVDSIKESDAAAIIEILAADAMKGRANGSPEILKTGISNAGTSQFLSALYIAGI